jgi:short subunit fatty acids transporter
MPHDRSKQSKISEAVVVIILGLVLMAFVHWGFGLIVFVGLLMLFGPADVARGR